MILSCLILIKTVFFRWKGRCKPRNWSKFTKSNISTTSSDSEHYPITSKLLNNSRSATLPRPPRNIKKQVHKISETPLKNLISNIQGAKLLGTQLDDLGKSTPKLR